MLHRQIFIELITYKTFGLVCQVWNRYRQPGNRNAKIGNTAFFEKFQSEFYFF